MNLLGKIFVVDLIFLLFSLHHSGVLTSLCFVTGRSSTTLLDTSLDTQQIITFQELNQYFWNFLIFARAALEKRFEAVKMILWVKLYMADQIFFPCCLIILCYVLFAPFPQTALGIKSFDYLAGIDNY